MDCLTCNGWRGEVVAGTKYCATCAVCDNCNAPLAACGGVLCQTDDVAPACSMCGVITANGASLCQQHANDTGRCGFCGHIIDNPNNNCWACGHDVYRIDPDMSIADQVDTVCVHCNRETCTPCIKCDAEDCIDCGCKPNRAIVDTDTKQVHIYNGRGEQTTYDDMITWTEIESILAHRNVTLKNTRWTGKYVNYYRRFKGNAIISQD